MKRFLKYLAGILTVFFLGLILLGIMLSLPPVQKALLVWGLSGEDREVTIERVRIRPGSAVLRNVALITPEQKVEFARLTSEFRLAPLLFRRTLDLKSLLVTDLSITLEEPVEPEKFAFPEVYPGLLRQPPIDFRLAAVQADGVFQSAAAGIVNFTLKGEDLTSRGDEGIIETVFQIENRYMPDRGLLFAELGIKPQFDSAGIFQQLQARLFARTAPENNQLATAEFTAHRTDQGENYRLEINPGSALSYEKQIERPILKMQGEWQRESGKASGTFDLHLEKTMIQKYFPQHKVPDFTMRGQNTFTVTKAGTFELAGENTVSFRTLREHFAFPDELDILEIDTAVQLAYSQDFLRIEMFNAGITSGPGTDLARLQVPSIVQLDFSAEQWNLPDQDDPLLTADFPGIPPELVNLLFADFTIDAEPITARTALYGRNNRILIETIQPLTITNLSITGLDEPLVQGADIQVSSEGIFSPADFDFKLAAEMKIPQLSTVTLQAETAGVWPLRDTSGKLRVIARDITEKAPFSDLDLTAELSLGHNENSDLIPQYSRFESKIMITPRLEFSPYLPGHLLLKGEISRKQDTGFPYTIQAFLPDYEDEQTERPDISLEGVFDSELRKSEGSFNLTVPAWLTAAAASHDSIQSLTAAVTGEYLANLEPLKLNIESFVNLELDTGQEGLPGQGRFLIENKFTGEIKETITLRDFRSVISSMEAKNELLTINQLRPLSWKPETSLFAQIPEGDIIDVKLGESTLAEWLPEAQRQNMTGGKLSGGIRIQGGHETLFLQPGPQGIVVESFHPGRMGEAETVPFNAVIKPFARINRDQAFFGLQELTLIARNQPLLRASLNAHMPFTADLDGQPNITGALSVRSNAAAVNHIMKEPLMPYLTEGMLVIDTDFGVNTGADFRVWWESNLVIEQLQSALSPNPFAVNVDFKGQVKQNRGNGRIIAEVEHRNIKQKVTLDVTAENEKDEAMPAFLLRGSSDFLNLQTLGEFGAVFTLQPEIEAKPVETLLPLPLEAEMTAARLSLSPELDLSNVVLRMSGDHDEINIQQMQAEMFGSGRLQARASLQKTNGTVTLSSSGAADNIAIEQFIKEVQKVEDPDIEGLFAFSYQVNSQGLYWHDLADRIEGVINITGSNGRMRFQIPDRRMARIRGLLGMREGAIGAAIARLAGAPKGVQALAESISLLTDMPYDSLSAKFNLTEEKTLELETMELLGPYIYAGGSGRMTNLDFQDLEQTSLHLEIEIGVKDRLRQQFHILNLLSTEQNPQGYQLMRRRPLMIGGTLGNPDLRPLWDLLIQAGIGAASPGELPEDEEMQRPADPYQDIFRGLRGILDF